MINNFKEFRIAKHFFLLNAIFLLLSLCIVNISIAEEEFPWELFYPAIIKKSIDIDVVRVGNKGTYHSIQEAIDSARDGAIIQVSQGTYFENLIITDPKRLTLQGGWNQEFTSLSGDSSLTVIDGGENDSVFYIQDDHGGTISLRIEGFTIQNGKAHKGGGFFIQSLIGSINVTLTNNTISRNIANNEGGGIRVNSQNMGSAVVTLTGNVITGNTVTHLNLELQGGWEGGGIAAYSASSGTTTLQLTNNLITENKVGWGGGGILGYAFGSNSMTNIVLTNNIIAWNEAEMGAAIFSCSGITDPAYLIPGGSVIWTLTNNIITGNIASKWVGGIVLYSGSIYGDGGTISLSSHNDIIWGNPDSYQSPQLAVIVEEGKSGIATAEVKYSDIGPIESIPGGTYTIDNVINADPQFVDPINHVLLLKDDSPCVDAGDPSSAYQDYSRPPAKGTERDDMGAYGGPNNFFWP